ncbi:penicillin-insensitive murein endopeptidase [Fulvimarina sp. 2208YS6-2-32]|uniref:Penicillin-insensitive murein endopeptidase n=1 Tax=Fulvimarina uroteuthidis TaxID=3098149 RepID=A0ABU5I1I5_9HYPH|nr:penicillin-insensitive murein endopeptidase [Fulvimarina sp. 2208YS6-2-32]MDY8108036.1 penicillin-insensitive murein endopeptidase [Fulvimarina sp. 2208YS6-2-32]
MNVMKILRVLSRTALACGALAAAGGPAVGQPAAKTLFSEASTPAPLPAESLGFYSKGCLAGAVQLPADADAFQAMRLSRDRRWGHPVMVDYLERFASEVKRRGIWPGVLFGDISMVRGGPMPSGHSSHQIGLDADVWLRPMPRERLSTQAREDFPFRSVLKEGGVTADDRIWDDSYRELIKLAASDAKVQRILVHPGIKKKLCETAGGDRDWLNKVRPYYGHDSHFHIRLFCQEGSPNCEPQRSTGKGDGCGDLDYWFDVALQPPPPDAKPYKKKPDLTMADLPASCRKVLTIGEGGGEALAAMATPPGDVPRPRPRPAR